MHQIHFALSISDPASSAPSATLVVPVCLFAQAQLSSTVMALYVVADLPVLLLLSIFYLLSLYDQSTLNCFSIFLVVITEL